MRFYIIGNAKITLCSEPPPAVNEGEIVVASNEELHAAALSGKRLLALWNALPGFEKRKKIGDRDGFINDCGRRSRCGLTRSHDPRRGAHRSRMRSSRCCVDPKV